jgi:thiamine biosynthesis lipoprotein
VFFLCFAIQLPAQMQRFSYSQQKMGAPFTIVFYSSDSIRANLLAKQCFNLVDSFVFIFSDYIDSSELSRLSATAGKQSGPVKLSPALYKILLEAKTAFYESEGTFDITVGPLVRLWRKARRINQFPPDDSVQSMRALVGFKKMLVDTLRKEATLSQTGMQLDLGGIAQGFIAQEVINFLTAQQVRQALVNCSGDIVMSGPPPGSKGWVIGINVPEATDELLSKNLLLQHRAVTTSGDVYQFMEHGGKRYSHIIDPRTGYGVTFHRNVTVIAKDGVTADWLATACSILPVKKAKRLAIKFGAALLITELRHGKLVYWATKGFDVFWKPGGH